MSEAFFQFGEAAKFYAQNAALVNEMKTLGKDASDGAAGRLYARYENVIKEMATLFDQEIERFADALGRRIAVMLKERSATHPEPWELADEDGSPPYRVLYDVDDENGSAPDDVEVPYLYYKKTEPGIVCPGVLNVFVQANLDYIPLRPQLTDMMLKSPLAHNCKATIGRNKLPMIAINYGLGDPVGNTAGPILTLLEALHRAKKALQPMIAASKLNPTAAS